MIAMSRSSTTLPPGKTGAIFRVISDQGNLDTDLFFIVDEEFRDLIQENESAFIPLIAMLALIRGEDVDLAGVDADPLLVRNVRSALNQLAQWYPEFRVPELRGVDTTAQHIGRRAEGAAAFLSGGIDSLFSLIRHSQGNASKLDESALGKDLSHAIHVYHTPDPCPPEDQVNLEEIDTVAGLRGTKLVSVVTNMMTFDRSLNDRWSDVGHGAGLATVLHLLSGGIGTGVIASSHTFGGLMPWGSSPLIDPLWSSNSMQIVHDGSTYTRVEKTALVAEYPDVLRSLNVCDNRIDKIGYVNCSKCQKCLRTMVTLDLQSNGDVAQFQAFDWSSYDPAQIGTIFLRTESEKSFIREIRKEASGNRPDIVAACDKALSKSLYLRPVSMIEKGVKKSGFGRRNREALIALRGAIYRSAGWAIKE